MQRYMDVAQEKWTRLHAQKSARLLAIETSCDETAAAVVRDGRSIESNVIWSQIEAHKVYGGVVPEIASRLHVEKIDSVVEEALDRAGITLDEIDAIAVTNGPGLVGCLLVGVSYGKALAAAKKLPLVAVHHIQGHIAANYLAHPALTPPFICLVASGGHSHIFAVKDYDQFVLLGATRDDAAGEAFDKGARTLGLSYPGGPELEKLAKNGNDQAFVFHSAFNAENHYDMSFSGMKTGLINLLHTAEQRGELLKSEDVAASFQNAIVSVLTDKALRACKEYKYDTLVLAGGVAANGTLRSAMDKRAGEEGLRFLCPPINLCTDNAAMIGSAGYFQLMAGDIADLDLNAVPNRKIV